jgi:putative Holliday junction resolvase
VSATPKSILGLDVGDRRIGVAVASLAARLPRPLTTLIRDNGFFDALQAVIAAEHVETLVVGFPRGLSGQHTAQTAAIEAFTDELRQHCELPVHLQDESVTSKQAEAELEARGKAYTRPDIDALAATYILEDFLAEHREAAR